MQVVSLHQNVLKVRRDINGENQPSPKTFIFGGFRGNFDPDDGLQGFWITPKTKKVTANLKIRIFNTIPASGDNTGRQFTTGF